MSINKALITGNLTRDPELRQTASGMAVLGFGVAVNDRRKDPQTGKTARGLAELRVTREIARSRLRRGGQRSPQGSSDR